MDETQLAAITQWISLLGAAINGGEALFAKIKGALADHGVAADLSALEAVIADAARRKALAAADAAGQ